MPRNGDPSNGSGGRIASNIRRKRIERSLTQGELAAQLGCDETTVQSWERGTTSPNADNIARLTAALEMRDGELFADCPALPERRAGRPSHRTRRGPPSEGPGNGGQS